MLKDGDPQEFQKSAVKLKRQSQELKDYCERTGLTYQNERTSVLGYSHSEASRVTAAYRRALKAEEEKLKQIALDNLKNRDILESRIQSGELPLKINMGQQKKHILDTNENKMTKDKSYLTISIDEIEEIVNTMHGTGIIQVSEHDHGLQFREIVTLDHNAGFIISQREGMKGTPIPTNQVKIHYSKKGYHIVPTIFENT